MTDPILSYAARATERDGNFPWRFQIERDNGYVQGIYLERRVDGQYQRKFVGLLIFDASLPIKCVIMGGKLFDHDTDQEPLPPSADLSPALLPMVRQWNNAVRAVAWWTHANEAQRAQYAGRIKDDLHATWDAFWNASETGGRVCGQ